MRLWGPVAIAALCNVTPIAFAQQAAPVVTPSTPAAAPTQEAAQTGDVPPGNEAVTATPAAPQAAEAPSGAVEAISNPPAATPAQTASTSTLDTIRVTAERPPVDFSKIGNRSEDSHTIFSRDWKDPVDLEDIGMRGGIIPIAVDYALRGIRAGARKIPGWKGPDQPAVARPPPDFDDDQLRRAAQFGESAAATAPADDAATP